MVCYDKEEGEDWKSVVLVVRFIWDLWLISVCACGGGREKGLYGVVHILTYTNINTFTFTPTLFGSHFVVGGVLCWAR